MEKREEYFGSTMIKNFLPTVPALRYLNCCTVAGWHCCNRRYHLRYAAGCPVVFVMLTVSGRGWIKTGGTRYELAKGNLAIIPENTPMEYATSSSEGNSSWEFYWLNLRGDYVQQTAQKLWTDGWAVHHCQDIHVFTQIFRWLLESSLSEQTRELEQSQKVQELFSILTSRFFLGKSADSAQVQDVSARVLGYIQKNYKNKITLEELGRYCFLSKNQIIRIIRKRTGYTPGEYIIRYRLMKACELLHGTVLPVSEIGNCVGYCNRSHFTAQFREVYGMTPTEYRSMLLQEEEKYS